MIDVVPSADSEGMVDLGQVNLLAAGNEFGERSGVSLPVPRSCTGKLTHAARQLPQS